MKHMNRKEIQDWAYNRDNWKPIIGNELVRFEILEYGSLRFGRAALLRVTNTPDIILHKAQPQVGFVPEGQIYEMESALACVGMPVSFTSVTDRIWREQKKIEEEKR